jgi:hypothetical protein
VVTDFPPRRPTFAARLIERFITWVTHAVTARPGRVATGALLFTVEPQDYAANRAFLTKAALVLLGILHALYVHSTATWRRLSDADGAIGFSLRLSALISLTLWTAAILAGRLIAF